MSKLNTILVATDLSDASLVAVSRGLNLAEQHHLECTILHVIPRELMFDLERLAGRSGSTLERDATERQTRELNSNVRAMLEGRHLNVHTRIRCGQPAEEISEQAREDQAELIVVSSQGQGAVKRMLVRSTTMGVLHDSPCPVLVVRSPDKQTYRKVILAIDFSDASNPLMQVALQYAPDAHFVMMHRLEAPFDDMQRLARLDTAQVDTYRQAAQNQAAEQLDALARSHGLQRESYSIEVVSEHDRHALLSVSRQAPWDLIVTGKHGHHVTRDRLLGSFTQSVLAHAECDVLVIQPR